MALRYTFMGSPPIAATILESLCAAGYRPELVVTQPPKEAGRGKRVTPTAVADAAARLGIDVIACANVNAEDVITRIRSAHPEVILVVAFGQLLREQVLGIPKYCLNVHASLLPKYRGAAPVQRAIWNGDATTGVTVQKMVRELDAGDVFVRKEIPIAPGETAGELLGRLTPLGAEAAREALERIVRGDVGFEPQDPAAVTHAPKIRREEAEIDWREPATRIRNQILALQPWPVAETWLGAKRLKVYRAEVVRESLGAPGTIATDHRTALRVACGDGALALTEVQLENKKRLAVADFLKGYQGLLPFEKVGR